MISIRHEGRAPYVSRTVIEWNGDITQGEADTVGASLDRILERGPGGLDDVLTPDQAGEREDEIRAELEENLADAEKRADEEEDRADTAEAELARVKGDVCGMCSRTHANDLGVCSRHGRPIAGFDLATEFRALSARYQDMRRKHEEASREVVQARAEVAALKRRKRTAA